MAYNKIHKRVLVKDGIHFVFRTMAEFHGCDRPSTCLGLSSLWSNGLFFVTVQRFFVAIQSMKLRRALCLLRVGKTWIREEIFSINPSRKSEDYMYMIYIKK